MAKKKKKKKKLKKGLWSRGELRTAERCGKKEGLQNGTSQVKEIPKDSWQSVNSKSILF
jgi:hypothetical protein